MEYLHVEDLNYSHFKLLNYTDNPQLQLAEA